MDYAHIAEIETWGSGGHMLDVITLTDGHILVIMDGRLVLYDDRSAFESGSGGRILLLNER